MLTHSKTPNAFSGFGYIPSLDGIRCIALLLVLAFHGGYGHFPGGWIGVDLFFVLSGYLITSLLQKEYITSGKILLTNFYARRILRLFPPLVLCILLLNILWPFLHVAHEANRLIAAAASLFYFANLVPNAVLGPCMHLWSLSVEEHFYVVWPLATFLFLFKIPFRKQVIALLSLLVVVTLLRIGIYNSSRFADPVATAYRFTLCRIDAIILGALLALAERNSSFKTDSGKNYLVYAGLIICFFAIIKYVDITNTYWYNGGFIFTNALCVFVVLFAIKNPTNAFLSNSVFRWIGRRSYGIYVYHMPLFMAFEGLRVSHSFSNLIFVTIIRLAATLLVAEVSFRFVETPLLKYKNGYKKEPRLSSAAETFSSPAAGEYAAGV